MANTLGYYNPQFYANEALIWLSKALGMAGRVHRGYDEERRAFNLGEVVNIRKPSVMTVADAPATASDITTESVQVTLDKWREVKFKLTDKELSQTGNRVIEEHIMPSAYALADDIDQKLALLYKDVPFFHDVAGGASTTAVAADITATRKILFDNQVPLADESRVHFMMDSGMEKALLDVAAFTQHQGSAAAGVETQMRGHLGTRYGMNFFANQNVQTHTKGTINDTALLINNASGYAVGTTTINLDAADAGVTGTLVAGDVLTIGSYKYAVTATNTASGNAFTGVTITPGLKAAVADNAVVTARADDHVASLAFHRDAFALVMARLPDHANFGGLGAQIASVQDPVTGLAVRARVYYVGNSSEVHVALDALYGVKTLNPYLAVRVCG